MSILKTHDFVHIKGLNFSIHADAAWGGYFCSMLRTQPESSPMPTAKETGFVPEMYMSSYVHEQLSALHHCDTITVDPHKSGFCPYPGGAICYRDRRINSFLSITTKVLYYHGKMILGDVGIEGSKPGAAAVGVMMANRVTIYESFSFSSKFKKVCIRQPNYYDYVSTKHQVIFSGSCVISSLISLFWKQVSLMLIVLGSFYEYSGRSEGFQFQKCTDMGK